MAFTKSERIKEASHENPKPTEQEIWWKSNSIELLEERIFYSSYNKAPQILDKITQEQKQLNKGLPKDYKMIFWDPRLLPPLGR